MDALTLAKQIEDYVIDIQRDLHLHPEIGLQEERTIQVIISELDKMGISYDIIPDGGVIGVIEGDHPGKSIALRGDIDALPMKEEEKNLKQPKVVVSKYDDASHTCGHDGHTAMLLGAAKILSEHKDQIHGKVILAFEQAEEIGGGIFNILNRLVDLQADGIWGIHLKSDIPSGKISVDPGPRMSAAFKFDVIIRGKSGHGSRPDLSNSPLDCFTDFYSNLQRMRLKSMDPFQALTYSVGSVTAGNAANVIPDDLRFSGTCRYLHYEQGIAAANEFMRLLETVCETHQCTYEYVGKPAPKDSFVYNEETCAQIAEDAVKNALGEEVVYSYPAWMASEPFGFYQKYMPGVFAFVGIQNEEKGTGAEHHNAYFEIDEDVLKLGVAATVQYTIDFLKYKGDIPFVKETQEVRELMQDAGAQVNEPSLSK